MRVLRRGDTGPDVTEINTLLETVGVLAPSWSTAGTDMFTQETERAVRGFQQDRGLAVDGLVGPATYRTLRGATYHLGSRPLTHIFSSPAFGDDVLALQDHLIRFGYDVGRPDASFGPRTQSALRKFQHETGLDADGVCGAETIRALRGLLNPRAVGGRPVLLREQERLRRFGARLRGKRVVIDPGHGGNDTGAVGGRATESELMWDLARRVEGRMIAVGMDALLSRGPHQSPSAQHRAELANDAGADLLLSLHCDHNASDNATGVATFYYGNTVGPASSVGEVMAGFIQRELVARTGLPDCRIHPKTWDILTHTRCPALRIEIGYITNIHDRELLEDAAFGDLVAEGILVAVKRMYLLDEMNQPMTGTFTFGDVLRHELA